jgi:hypothetical protein
MAYNLISQGVTPENFGAGAPGGFAGMLDRFSKGFGVGMSRYQNLGDSLRSYQDRNIASSVNRERARNEMMDSRQTRATRTMANASAEVKAVLQTQIDRACIFPNSAECMALKAQAEGQNRAEAAAGLAPYTDAQALRDMEGGGAAAYTFEDADDQYYRNASAALGDFEG